MLCPRPRNSPDAPRTRTDRKNLMRKALVTGSAGFIGYHLSKRLLDDGFAVVGIDNLSDYYDVALKQRRQAELLQSEAFRAINDPIETPGLLMDVFSKEKFDVVISNTLLHHLANPTQTL